MPTLSPEIIPLFSTFRRAFTRPTFCKALTLACGAILAPGQRTVAAALRAMGLGPDAHFTNYHHVLNRDRWSPWVLSRLLWGRLMQFCPSTDQPVVLLIDETLERRRGQRIKLKGWFRDPIRSTVHHLVTALGLRWICLAVLVPVPWSRRPWALPFMTVPALSRDTSAQLHRRQRTLVQWAQAMITRVRRWQPGRALVLVGDGSYSALALVRHCQHLDRVRFTSRLRLDAKLHDFPAQPPKSPFGPKPKKGARQVSLEHRLTDPMTAWQPLLVQWYDGQTKLLDHVSGVSLWAKRGEDPVAIRWVLVRCPADPHFKPEAFYCSDPSVSVTQIMAWVIARWNLEVTFAELHAHLGFETQRQWSDRAIERTTPCLFGLLSLVVLIAWHLHPETLPIRTAAWYPKTEATFSDVLAAVRNHFWKSLNRSTSSLQADQVLLPRATLSALLDIACYST